MDPRVLAAFGTHGGVLSRDQLLDLGAAPAEIRRLVRVTRLYWEDYWGERRAEAIRRLQADHADSVAQYGAVLDPELAREAAEIRARTVRRRTS